MCACRGCYLLFTAEGAGGGRFRAVPDRYRRVPRLRAHAGAVGRAADPGERGVLLRQLDARPGRRVLPEPGGATESLLPLDAWDELVAANPELADAASPTSRRSSSAPTAAPARPSASSCRSTPATSWSASCGGCGAASTAGSEAHDALDAFFAGVRRREPAMTDAELSFEVLDARAEPYAAVPTLVLRLRITETSGDAGARRRAAVPDPHRAAAPPLRRRRGGARSSSCSASPRWGESLRPFLVDPRRRRRSPAFTGSTEVDLPVPCTYDFEVAGTKYLHALADDGDIPLVLLFSGTAFVRGGRRARASTPVAWHEEATFRLPGARCGGTMMDLYFPNSGWLTRQPRRRSTRSPRFKARAGARRRGTRRSSACSRKPGRTRSRDATGSPPRAAVADAVLYEGYVLYPYRASARKNQVRWQFGVLVPPRQRRATARSARRCAPSASSIPAPTPTLHVRVRCLQVQHRTVEAAVAGGGFAPVDELEVDGATLGAVGRGGRARDRPRRAGAAARSADAVDGAVRAARRRRRRGPRDAAGELVGRVVRGAAAGRRRRARRRRAGPTGPARSLTVARHASRTSPTGRDPGAPRDEVVRRSLVAVHTLLAVDDGAFVSLLDPPDDAAAAVAGCTNDGTFPVLVGDAGRPWCCRRRSSSTTTRRSRPRARATSATPPRSTRSSRCGCSR